MKENQPIGDRVADVLRLLLEATRCGAIRWGREADGETYSAVGREGGRFFIQLLYPLYVDESSDRAAARISTPHVDVFYVFAGTTGMELVWAVLTAAFPDQWSGHWARIDERIQRDLDWLRQRIAASNQPPVESDSGTP